MEKMKVLFLVWTTYPSEAMYGDPSVFYRCYHPAESLRELGCNTAVVHFTLATEEVLGQYDYIVFFRPQFSDKFIELISATIKTGLPFAASYDDLYFDIELLRQSNFRGLPVNQHTILASRPYNYAQAMYFFDHFIVSTDPLGDRISALRPGSRVHVQYNAASEEMLALAEIAVRAVQRVPRRIGYFAGGASHGPDIEAISGEVAAALDEGDAEFLCVETVKVPAEIAKTGRVVTIPRMSYAGMIKAYASCCVTVAPLHMNIFTDCKSGIKYLEASMVGAACVATPITDILRIADHRLVAVREGENWTSAILEALSLPINDEVRREQFERVQTQFSTLVEAERLLSFASNM